MAASTVCACSRAGRALPRPTVSCRHPRIRGRTVGWRFRWAMIAMSFQAQAQTRQTIPAVPDQILTAASMRAAEEGLIAAGSRVDALMDIAGRGAAEYV